ncbi:MAG: tetratricopeptide repeat protein [Verrucomicrobium sp.]|nr:tetratricopeptide repeat protein [Verrucomicrobium sp.]
MDLDGPLHARLDQASLLLSQGRLAEMLDVLEPLLPLLGNDASFQCARGIALLTLDEPEAGELALRRAVALNPRLSRARVYHAAALADLGQTQEALNAYEEALRLEPENPEARTHRALLWLSRGRLAEGWEEYEWRFRLSSHLLGGPPPHTPRWSGEPLEGRTLLLLAEQGLGDTLQFARFAARAKEAHPRATVILECQPELVRLLQGAPGFDAVVRRGPAPPPHDVHLPLLSLPRFFCPDPAAIPPPLFLPAVEIPAAPPPGSPRRIGVAWAGGRANTKDRSRSCPPEALAPLRNAANVEWINLQKEAPGAAWLPFASDLSACEDFLDTARVVAGLDLVITVDTAVAHLAGSLGKPVWILLPEPSCWRWMTEAEATPWYPSARLFRQARHGDWDGLLARVATELARI